MKTFKKYTLSVFLVLLTGLGLVAQNKAEALQFVGKKILKQSQERITAQDLKISFDRIINFADSMRFRGYTLAQIRSLPKIVVQSYGTVYCNEAGKEGFFKYDPTDSVTVEDGAVAAVTIWNGRVKRIITGNTVYPEWWGAKADSLTDCTTAFRAAAAYLGKRKGGRVQGNYGTYLISGTITLPSNVEVQGVAASIYSFAPGQLGNELGGGTIIKVKQNGIMSGLPVFNVAGSSYVSIRNITFLVHGNNEKYNTTKCIADSAANTASFLTVQYCRSRWFGGEFVLLHANGLHNISNNRCNNHFSSIIRLVGTGDSWVGYNDLGSHQDNLVGGTTTACIEVSGAANNTFIGNYCYNMGYGYKFTNGSAYNKIIGGRAEKNSYAGFYFDGAVSNTIDDCHAFNNGYVGDKVGFQVRSGSRSNVFTGCYSFGEPQYPGGTLQLYGWRFSGNSEYNLMVNCYVKNVGEMAITFDNSSHNSVLSSFIYNVKQFGILAQNNSSDLNFSNNTIRNVGQATNAAYDGIFLNVNCDRVLIAGNSIRHGGGVIRARSGVRVNDPTCQKVTIMGNDLEDAGITANLIDFGENTIIRANAGYSMESNGNGGGWDMSTSDLIYRIGGVQRLKVASTGETIIGTSVSNTSDALQVGGNINLTGAGNKLKITTGTNASAGTATLVAGTVTVNTTAVTANSIILLTAQDGTPINAVGVSARVAGTSFTITSSSNSDVRPVGYVIFN